MLFVYNPSYFKRYVNFDQRETFEVISSRLIEDAKDVLLNVALKVNRWQRLNKVLRKKANLTETKQSQYHKDSVLKPNPVNSFDISLY